MRPRPKTPFYYLYPPAIGSVGGFLSFHPLLPARYPFPYLFTILLDMPAAPRAPAETRAMHVRSPLVPSRALSALAGREVLLKLDNVQPSGSFKLRGHGHLARDAVARGADELVCSSGGNAGAAVAYAASILGVRARIVVPTSTPAFMVSRLRDMGAVVDVYGDVWDEADAHARKTLTKSAAYVPPFDDERLWEGIASLPRELRDDMGGRAAAAVALAVGGGGLFCGTAKGMSDVGWGDVPIVCAETEGAQSFQAMVKAGRCVALTRIDSIAKSLGALQVAQKCADWVHERKRKVRSVVVSDKEAVEACSLLATHHRILVEPACGAAVAAVLRREDMAGIADGPVVIIICGGNMVSTELLDKWIETTGATRAEL